MTKKRIVAVVLVLALLLQSAGAVFAAAAPNAFSVEGTHSKVVLEDLAYDLNGDGKFYYVAVGDSVAASMGTHGAQAKELKDSQNLLKLIGQLGEMFGGTGLVPADNYKNCAQDGYPALVAKSLFKTLQDSNYLSKTLPFGYDVADEGGNGFGWSNLGMSAYMVGDIYNTLAKSSSICKLYDVMFTQWGYGAYLGYGTELEAAYAKLDAAAKKSGYLGLFEVVNATEEQIAAEKANETELYKAIMDGKTGNYEELRTAALQSIVWLIFLRTHDLTLSELQKADLITMQLGSNDLLTQLILDMYEKIIESYFSGNTNELLNAVVDALVGLLLGYGDENSIQYVLDAVENAKIEDILDIVIFLDRDNMSKRLQGYTQKALADYKDLVTLLRTGLDKDGKVAYTTDKDGNLVFVPEEDRDGIDPSKAVGVNPDAKIVFAGISNPFGADLLLPEYNKDETEVSAEAVEYDIPHVLQRIYDKAVEVLVDSEDYISVADVATEIGTDVAGFLAWTAANSGIFEKIDELLTSPQFALWTSWAFNVLSTVEAWTDADKAALANLYGWYQWIETAAPNTKDAAEAFIDAVKSILDGEAGVSQDEVQKYLKKIGAEAAVLLSFEAYEANPSTQAYVDALRKMVEDDLLDFVATSDVTLVTVFTLLPEILNIVDATDYEVAVQLGEELQQLIEDIEDAVDQSKALSAQTMVLADQVVKDIEWLISKYPEFKAAVENEIKHAEHEVKALFDCVIGEVKNTGEKVAMIPAVLLGAGATLVKEFPAFAARMYAYEDAFAKKHEVFGEGLEEEFPAYFSLYSWLKWVNPDLYITYDIDGTDAKVEASLTGSTIFELDEKPYKVEVTGTIGQAYDAVAKAIKDVGAIVEKIQDNDILGALKAIAAISGENSLTVTLRVGTEIDDPSTAVLDRDVTVSVTNTQLKNLLEVEIPAWEVFYESVKATIKDDIKKGEDLVDEWKAWAKTTETTISVYGEGLMDDAKDFLKNLDYSDVAHAVEALAVSGVAPWLEWTLEYVVNPANYGHIDELTCKAWADWYAWFNQEQYVVAFKQYIESQAGTPEEAVAAMMFADTLEQTLDYINYAITTGSDLSDRAVSDIETLYTLLTSDYSEVVAIGKAWSNWAEKLPAGFDHFTDVTFEEVAASIGQLTEENINNVLSDLGETGWLTWLTWAAINLTDDDMLADDDALIMSAWVACGNWFMNQGFVQDFIAFVESEESMFAEDFSVYEFISDLETTISIIEKVVAQGESAVAEAKAYVDAAKAYAEKLGTYGQAAIDAWKTWVETATAGADQYTMDVWTALTALVENLTADTAKEAVFTFAMESIGFWATWVLENGFTEENLIAMSGAARSAFYTACEWIGDQEFVQEFEAWLTGKHSDAIHAADERIDAFKVLYNKTLAYINGVENDVESAYQEAVVQYISSEELYSATIGSLVSQVVRSICTLASNNINAKVDKLSRTFGKLAGSSDEWKDLADHILADPATAVALIGQIIAGQDMGEVGDYALSQIIFPIIYLFIGQTNIAAINLLDEGLEAFAEADGNAVAVKLDGVLNELNTDPHPNSYNHAAIAQDILDAIVIPTAEVEVSLTEDDEEAVVDTVVLRTGASATFKVVVTPWEDKVYVYTMVPSVKVDGEPVALTEDGTFTVENITEDTTVEVATTTVPTAKCIHGEDCPLLDFVDIDDLDVWYHDAMVYCIEKGYFSGHDDKTLDPEGNMTREQFLSVLYRVAGSPEVEIPEETFSDVEAGEWYEQAIAWGTSLGIVSGYGDGTFGIGDEITREQAVAFLYRYTKLQGEGMEGTWAFQLDYVDASDIEDWAYEAVCWATVNGIIVGDENKMFNPTGFAERAEIAQIIYEYTSEE